MIASTDTDAPIGYYGKPIVKAHVWKDYIGWYFFTGGLAGASSVIAAVAQLSGRPALARMPAAPRSSDCSRARCC